MSRPGTILQRIEKLQIVPVTMSNGDDGYVVAFEERESLNHRTQRITYPPESRVVAVELPLDLSSARVLSESRWGAEARLIAAVPVEQRVSGGTEQRIRCALLESELRLDRASTTEIITSRHYLLRDPVSGHSTDLLAADWPGKVEGAFYRPLGAGGKVIDGSTFVVLAERSTTTPDTYQYALVALRVNSDDFRVSGELVLSTPPPTGRYESPFQTVTITPVSKGPADGWIVVQASAGQLTGIRIDAAVTTVTSGVIAALPAGAVTDSVRVAGCTFAASASGGGTGGYLATFNRPIAGLPSNMGMTFVWAPPSASLGGGPGGVIARSYGPSTGPSALAVDTRTDSHWYLADWGTATEPTSIEERRDEDSVSVVPTSDTPRFGPSRLRFSRLGASGTAYWRAHTFDPPRLMPTGTPAVCFDHRRDLAVMAFQSAASDENRVVAMFVPHPRYSVVSFEAEDCPDVAPKRSDPTNPKTFALGGARSFTIWLINGPANTPVRLWVGRPFLVRTTGPCDFAVRVDDPGTSSFRTTTEDSGNARVSLSLAETGLGGLPGLPRVFDQNQDSFRSFGAILDFPLLLVAQWGWFEFEAFDPGSLFGGMGGPGIDVATGNSNPLILFVT